MTRAGSYSGTCLPCSFRSFFTGTLIARHGAERIALLGLLILAVGGGAALLGLSFQNFAAALIFLGLGWNFAFIGATTMVAACYRAGERSKVQAVNDFAIFITVAVASLLSGRLLAGFGPKCRQLCAVSDGRAGIPRARLAGWTLAPEQGETCMSLEPWLAFTAATIMLLVIPGPTILLVVSYALGQGWRSALPISIGVALGDFTAMTLSMLGIGALLSASASVFTVLKLVGAAYLIYLGIKLWRAGGRLQIEAKPDTATPGKMLTHAWLVTALNPKSITFFVAFLPQFLDARGDVPAQMVIFETTFLVLAFANALGYALLPRAPGRWSGAARPFA